MATTAPQQPPAKEFHKVVDLPAPSGPSNTPVLARQIHRPKFRVPKWVWGVILVLLAFAGWRAWQSYAQAKITFETVPLSAAPSKPALLLRER